MGEVGRPQCLSHADEWELYVCRKLGAEIKACSRGFHVSIPTVNRVIAKFRRIDERKRAVVRSYRAQLDALRPAFPSEPKRTGPVGAPARRRWLKSRATPRWADRSAMREMYAEAKRLTRETGIRHEVDHIYPVSSSTICGLHVHTNLRIMTATANLAKSNRWEASYE